MSFVFSELLPLHLQTMSAEEEVHLKLFICKKKSVCFFLLLKYFFPFSSFLEKNNLGNEEVISERRCLNLGRGKKRKEALLSEKKQTCSSARPQRKEEKRGNKSLFGKNKRGLNGPHSPPKESTSNEKSVSINDSAPMCGLPTPEHCASAQIFTHSGGVKRAFAAQGLRFLCPALFLPL